MSFKIFKNLKRFKGIIIYFGLVLLFPSLILNYFLLKENRNKFSDQTIKVIGIIDGDTVVLEGKTKLRLRTVDAPELEFCGGVEAKEFLEKLVKNKRVTVSEQIIDQMGRPMALIFRDDVLINEKVLAAGWGKYHSDTITEKLQLQAAYEKAKTQKLGIFSQKCRQTENTENPECNIKGNIDNRDKDIKRYYYPGCVQYEFAIVEKDIGEQWFCSEEEAQAAGYIKSKTCH
jgi:endonuclease YncB( thermonuclease family)